MAFLNILLIAAAINSPSVWWGTTNTLYSFETDLNKAKGGTFIKEAMRTMDGMRKAYASYVPSTREVGVCKVKVFKSFKGYNEYINKPGNTTNCGMWVPMKEELLIVAEDPKNAQTTMRHEAFHQYIYYATGRGDHAMWFNEGMACFFESIKYNTANKTVKVQDDGMRARWVDHLGAMTVASRFAAVRQKSYSEFYSGDVNSNYITAWALCYFLERAPGAHKRYAGYEKVMKSYLNAMESGQSAAEATLSAFAQIDEQKLIADFVYFWEHDRKRARKAK